MLICSFLVLFWVWLPAGKLCWEEWYPVWLMVDDGSGVKLMEGILIAKGDVLVFLHVEFLTNIDMLNIIDDIRELGAQYYRMK